ncbi:hypothetical protein HSRCO_0956 [Halanaeroarchaeum sp. HSR-CO]|nr:hypothetical protein HSRCO_0956 [Halanaeroarchaeum sp. HSR-CO]
MLVRTVSRGMGGGYALAYEITRLEPSTRLSKSENHRDVASWGISLADLSAPFQYGFIPGCEYMLTET